MFDHVREFMKQIESLPADQRSKVTTVAIFWAIAYTAYYITLGVAVIILGRRLIYALLNAWKETRRESP